MLEQSLEIVRRRLDETGTKELLIQPQGVERIILQVPGIKDPERVKSILGKTAKMSFHTLHPEKPIVEDIFYVPSGYMILLSDDNLEDEMDKIRVVPNPYVMTNLLEEAIYSRNFNQRRKLMFIHLPSRCTINIYTVSGILVDRIEVDNPSDNGVAYWDLLTNESLEVAAGMYVYHIKSLVNENGPEKVGKFAIIK